MQAPDFKQLTPQSPPYTAPAVPYDADKPESTFAKNLGSRQCTARTRQTGLRCGKPPEPGKDVCRKHGGNRRVGRKADKGRYSKAMGKLAHAYQAALSDQSLTDLREPLAALDAITKRIAQRAAERDTPDFRKRILVLVTTARDAMRDADVALFTAKLNELHKLAEEGADEDSSLTVAADAFGAFSTRLEAHWKIRLDRKQAINARDLIVLMQRFVDIVRMNVSPEAASRVALAMDGVMMSTFGYMAEDPERMKETNRN